jgi:tetratricopeptide (TPR) repeat protein
MAEDLRFVGESLQPRLAALVQQWSQGQTSLKQIMGLSEEELYAIASQGYYLFLEGKAEPAKLIFEGLVAIDPRNAYYYRALGAIYWRLKDAQRAVRQFGYAIRVAPDDVASYINRAEVYVASQQFDQAGVDLRAALDIAQDSQRALRNKALAMLRMIDLRGASVAL